MFPLLLLIISLLPFSMAVDADEITPVPYQAVYELTYKGLPLEGLRELSVSGEAYTLTTSAKSPLGYIKETEQFSLHSDGTIRIDSYQYERSVLGSKRYAQLSVDKAANKIIYTDKKKRREIEFLKEYLGPISYQLQLRRDLKRGCDTLSYQVISRGRVKNYRFTREGSESISTKMGTVNTLKVQRVREGKGRNTIFWMSPQWDFLPVKIWQTEKNGETYVMLLKSLLIDNKVVTL